MEGTVILVFVALFFMAAVGASQVYLFRRMKHIENDES